MAVMRRWIISWGKGREEGLVSMEMWNEVMTVNMLIGMMGMKVEEMDMMMGMLGRRCD